MMKEIDIGDLSQKSGLSTATIRFYETKGLIRPIGRHGLRRQYAAQTLQTLGLIQLLKNSGLTLKEIQHIFIMDNKIKIDRDTLETKIVSMQEKVEQLNTLIRTLQHVQHCPHPDHLACPEFIKLLALNHEA